MSNKRDTCVEPSIGKFLAEGLAGDLAKPGRENDLKKFEEHARNCNFCWRSLLEAAHREVVIPFLKERGRPKRRA